MMFDSILLLRRKRHVLIDVFPGRRNRCGVASSFWGADPSDVGMRVVAPATQLTEFRRFPVADAARGSGTAVAVVGHPEGDRVWRTSMATRLRSRWTRTSSIPSAT